MSVTWYKTKKDASTAVKFWKMRGYPARSKQDGKDSMTGKPRYAVMTGVKKKKSKY